MGDLAKGLSFDVTLKELDNPREGRLGHFLNQIERLWVDGDSDRYENVRCASIQVRNEFQGGGCIAIHLRFPLDMEMAYEVMLACNEEDKRRFEEEVARSRRLRLVTEEGD